MRDGTWNLFSAGMLIGGCLLTLACGGSGTTDGEDAGTPDSGQQVQNYACPVPTPTACPDPAPRYADVSPIFQERCVTCHINKPGGSWALTDYAHIADWQDTIRTNVRDCTMPPADAGVMPLEERTLILTWIQCGLPR